ncbi:hypothetical protein PuT2_02245 [Pusillimonas sp. T2]|uniref:polysaccharide deacetylase family protein n=1 Tax=Pusillimonas sp. T2 TaxID=1548123 RepID=UPI000B9D1C4C|nr:polysaccharide deacetylase family protein [Pusillimonas sp. T2]OXR50709.1 hypothetical protein PuT2_02245 [Pusillimonas sp. T2]
MTFFAVRTRTQSRYLAWVLLVLALGLHAVARAQPTVALTFDDGFNAEGNNRVAAQYNKVILDTLRNKNIKAMLFPLGALADNPDTMALVKAWGNQGHAIGNHTYSHQALSSTNTRRYLEDIKRADLLLRQVPGWCARLRFPYLDEGKTPEQRAEVLQWLAAEGYGVASATISLPDWELTKQYETLLNNADTSGAKAFLNDYTKQVITQARAQENYWQGLLKRSPAHVLLLHANPLNADALPSIIDALRQDGWHFVTPASAFADPIYQRALPASSANDPAVTLPTPMCN